jgi:hypothetical protein
VTRVDITIRAYDPDDAGSGVSWSGACWTAVAAGMAEQMRRRGAEPGQARGDQDCGLKTTLCEHSEVIRVLRRVALAGRAPGQDARFIPFMRFSAPRRRRPRHPQPPARPIPAVTM